MIARSNDNLHNALYSEWLQVDPDTAMGALRLSEWVAAKYGLYIQHDHWHFKDPHKETLFRITHGHVL